MINYDDYKKLITKAGTDAAAKFNKSYGSDKDMQQEAGLAYAKAVKQFDESRGNEFSTYLYKAVYNAVIAYCTKEANIPVCSDIDEYEPQDFSADAAGLNVIFDLLDEDEKIICKLVFIDGYNPRETGEKIGKAYTTVYKIIERIRRKLAKAYNIKEN